MAQQVPVDPESIVAHAEADAPSGGVHAILPDLGYRRLGIVNIVLVGSPGAGDRRWVLVDAGLPGTKGLIEHAAAARFGEGSRPAAIVMTHGHFDHVGALEALAAEWDAPVYAHALERPYLDGSASYPPADPTVGGGMMALLSPLYPTRPVEVGSRLRTLPVDGGVPPMPGWRWIHTPGHSAGQVAFWREADGALIAGDAFVTVAQESAYAVATQEPEIHGPPRYLTVDWDAAATSVRTLAALRPEVAITGHGRPLGGQALRDGLDLLTRDFATLAVPASGRYTKAPANAKDGSVYRKS